MSSGNAETVAIPKLIRELVDARDKFFCRVCGKYLGVRRALHHIDFGGDAQGMGGRRDHSVENLISVCWLPGDNGCHERLHSDKRRYLDLALRAAKESGVTVIQLERWANARSRGENS